MRIIQNEFNLHLEHDKKTEKKAKKTKEKQGDNEKEERFVNPIGIVFDEEKPSKGSNNGRKPKGE